MYHGKGAATIWLLDESVTHNAVEISVPQQHSAVVACWRVEVKDQCIGTVPLPADVRDVIPNHCLLRG